MAEKGEEDVKRISIDLPVELVEGVDKLRKEWGLRRRGLVFERLLEEIFSNDSIDQKTSVDKLNPKGKENKNDKDNYSSSTEKYSEDKALVIIGNSNIEMKEVAETKTKTTSNENNQYENISSGIELPGFIRKKTINLKKSLSNENNIRSLQDTSITKIKYTDLLSAKKATEQHWISLYGQKPTANVHEASMIWLARDIWPHVDGTENIPFTWNAACKIMNSYCKSWNKNSCTFDDVIVMAGVLEDPFSSNNLSSRIPTIIRRFVNRFKRSQNVTSFQTLESTMTVHGALNLLDLPTKAGSSLTLSFIRDAYKAKALSNHPDAGGSNETMRRLNEAYQLLKDLYKNNDTD